LRQDETADTPVRDHRVGVQSVPPDTRLTGQRGQQAQDQRDSGAAEPILEQAQSDMAAILRHLSLARSEDVGRVIFALVDAGLVRKQESDSKADFHGLFNLEE
jgi:uncharacterized repeat protein (TIGR04138 family)